MQQMSHYVSHALVREHDARMDRELEVRRMRAVRARRETRAAFYAYARDWRDFLFGSRSHVVHG